MEEELKSTIRFHATISRYPSVPLIPFYCVCLLKLLINERISPKMHLRTKILALSTGGA